MGITKPSGTLNLLNLIVREFALDGSRQSLLDIGCGDGLLSARLHQFFTSVVAIDADSSAIALAKATFANRTGLDFRSGNAENASEVLREDEIFDCIVSVLALHHMQTDQVLAAAKRHIGPKGRIIIVDIYADDKRSFLSYFLDQFIWSLVRHPFIVAASIRILGWIAAIRYLEWRLKYSLSWSGKQHIMTDLSLGLPLSLSEWREALERSLPGGALTLAIASTFVFMWSNDKIARLNG